MLLRSLLKDHILIIDDFTNSGSTLFGAVEHLGKLVLSGVLLMTPRRSLARTPISVNSPEFLCSLYPPQSNYPNFKTFLNGQLRTLMPHLLQMSLLLQPPCERSTSMTCGLVSNYGPLLDTDYFAAPNLSGY